MSGGEALGMIETRGLIGAIEAADTALKSAEVTVVARQKAGSGLHTVLFRGDVASVREAVDVGAAAARRVGELVSAHVIARPVDSLVRIAQRGTAGPGGRISRKQNRRSVS